MSKYARKVDAIQSDVVAALRRTGHQVVLMHAVGGGFPDIIACRHGQAHFIEIKSPKGRLTPAQQIFFEEWRGPEIHVVRSVDDALIAADGWRRVIQSDVGG